MTAPEIAEQEWDAHREVIAKSFRKLTAKQLLEYLKTSHGFCPTSNQLETRLRKWGLRKNIHKEQWQNISPADERKLENGSSIVTVNGVMIDRKKWFRAKKWARRQQSLPVQEEDAMQRSEDGTRGPAPPVDVELCADIISNTPFSQFDLKFNVYMREYRRTASSHGGFDPAIVHTQLETEAGSPVPLFSPPTIPTQGPGGSLQSPGVQWESKEASLRCSSAGSPDQDAYELLGNILGVYGGPEAPEYSTKVAARLQETMMEQVGSHALLQIDQFPRESKVEQTFQLLRCAINLASNNLLPIGVASKLLSWLLKSDTFWVAHVIVSMRTPTTDTFASVLLVSAAKLPNLTICNFLLNEGADPNATAPSGAIRSSTALLEAVRQRNSALVRFLVDSGAKVNMAMTLLSPLSNAVLINRGQRLRVEIIRLLVDKGADIHQDIGDGSRTTIFNFVVRTGDVEVATIFLQSNPAVHSFPTRHHTPLQIAVQAGSVGLVEILLKAGVDINGRCSPQHVDGEIRGRRGLSICAFMTPLQVALAEDHTAVAALLLRQGADVNGLDGKDCLKAQTCDINIRPLFGDHHLLLSGHDLRAASSPLQIAALHRDVSTGRLLLGLGAKVNAHGGFGTALQTAATQRDNLAFVQLLLDSGADVNAPASEPRGRTALQAAAEAGDCDTVKLLLYHHASVNADPSCEGVTALQAAASRGDTLLVAQLIYVGADVNAPAAANNGQTALQAAVAAGHTRTVQLLLQNEANIFASSALTGGCSVLEAAMRNPKSLSVLLHHGKAECMLTLLQEAVGALFPAIDVPNYHEITDVLRKNGFEARRSDLQQALQAAVDKRDVKLAKKWIHAGASAEMCLQDPIGRTSLLSALVETYSPAFCDLFIRSDAVLEGDYGTEALLVAVSNDCPHMLRYLLSKGARPNWEDVSRANRPYPIAKVFEVYAFMERSRLARALFFHKEEMVEILLRHGAKLEGVTFSSQVCRLPLQTLRQLLEAGLEANRRLPDQDSLLQYATQNEMEAVVKLLLKVGADVNASPAPSKGNTALQSAVGIQSMRLVRLLLSQGADVNGPPSPEHGATALQRAVMGGSMLIFALLVHKGADVNAPAASVDGRTALEAAAEHGRLDMAHVLMHRDKDRETLWLRCQRAAKLAASHGFPILARELREWKMSESNEPREKDMYAKSNVAGS